MERLQRNCWIQSIISGQLTTEEINLSSKDENRSLNIIDEDIE